MTTETNAQTPEAHSVCRACGHINGSHLDGCGIAALLAIIDDTQSKLTAAESALEVANERVLVFRSANDGLVKILNRLTTYCEEHVKWGASVAKNELLNAVETARVALSFVVLDADDPRNQPNVGKQLSEANATIADLQSRLDAAERDAGRYRTKRSIDHERLKTTVAYERANDDERAMMEAAWFLSYDSAIDTRAAVLSASEDKGDKHD